MGLLSQSLQDTLSVWLKKGKKAINSNNITIDVADEVESPKNNNYYSQMPRDLARTQ